MKTYLSFFLILFQILKISTQQISGNISLGSSLTPNSNSNSSWLSPSGLFAFGFYPRGNGYSVGVFISGVPQKTVVWTANRDDPPLSVDVSLTLTTSGRLVYQTTNNGTGDQPIDVDLPEPASLASMLDTGNFVLYNSNHTIIWQTFDHPTDSLLPGQRLLPDGEMVSSVSKTDQAPGIFSLRMQLDGNLVQYPTNTPTTVSAAYYATNTDGQGNNISLNFDNDGHLYLTNSTGVNIHEISLGGKPTNRTIYLMRLDFDGIFRVYSIKLNQQGNQTIEWASSYNACDPKGMCGFNGFCVLEDREARCRCLPSFSMVQEGNWTSGCERNFTMDTCNSGGNMIQAVLNTVWEDAKYDQLVVSTRQECENACLNDCLCEAAIFNGQLCSKQRIPLRYGKRDLGSSNTLLVKVYYSSTSPNDSPAEKEIFLRESKKDTIIIVTVSLLVFVFLMFLVFGFVVHRKHVSGYKRMSENNKVGMIEEIALRSFTYVEVVNMTEDFKEEIGKGAFGTVFKGKLSQMNVAVKRLDNMSSEGEREFQNEMRIIGKTHHRNLVRLLGYCLNANNRLLVYEYMCNGSLADVLFKANNNLPCWDERIDIALNIARGLLYLHEECETQIIHCDIKPQNILMDENGVTKISDFGLSKLLNAEQTRTVTRIRGTKGYVAPEWYKKLPVTVKADVYSYGIVLLEIVCCRSSLNWSLSEDQAILDEWVYKSFVDGEILEVVGGSSEHLEKREVERIVKVALWCIIEEPSMRPTMKKVLLMLEGTVDIPVPPSPTSFLSSI